MLNAKHCFLLLLIGVGLRSFAQEDKVSEYVVGIKSGYGFIITHNPVMQFITNQHIQKLELQVEKNTFGTKAWQKRYGFPRIGGSFAYFNLNNEDHFGSAYFLSPHFNFKMFQNKKLRLGLKTSLGLGFIEKPFDTETNFKNAAIGSNFNVFIGVRLETEVKLTPKLNFTFGADFSHFSNSAFKTPNLGINIPTAEVGLSYAVGKFKERKFEEDELFERQKAKWIVNLAAGLTEINPPNEKKYVASYLGIAREHKRNYKNSVGASLDLFYNPSIVNSLAIDSIFIDKGWENMQIGVSVYHILHYGRMESFVNAGYYLKTNDEEIGNLYQMAGGRIRLTERLKFAVTLKTHLARAEYLMLGAQFNLKKRDE